MTHVRPRRKAVAEGFFLVAALVSAFNQAARAQRICSFHEIGTFGGQISLAQGLNDFGDVVGRAENAAGEGRAYFYDALTHEMTDLGSLHGLDSFAYDVNNRRQITGWSRLPDGLNVQAFLYQDGEMRDLGNLGKLDSYGLAINSMGQIVGGAADENEIEVPFLYQNGTMHALNGNFRSFSSATAINDAGIIVGGGLGSGHAFLYSGGTAMDLGALDSSYDYSGAVDINSSGLIVGESTMPRPDGDELRAVVFENGTINNLGALYGVSSGALAVNDQNDIVGRSGRPYSGAFKSYSSAFIYRENSMIDLNLIASLPEGWMLEEAWGINENGQIAGYGRNVDGFQRGFVLTPESSLDLLSNFRLSQELGRLPVGDDAPQRVSALLVGKDEPGSVQLYLGAIGLPADTEYVTEFLLNLDPALDPAQLAFTLDSQWGQGPAPTIHVGRDEFSADGAGLFDIQLLFPEGGERFDAGESLVFTISGIDSLTIDSFGFGSEPQGIFGALPTAAHVRGIGGDRDAWFSTIPEPSAILLGFLGLALLAPVIHGNRNSTRLG